MIFFIIHAVIFAVEARIIQRNKFPRDVHYNFTQIPPCQMEKENQASTNFVCFRSCPVFTFKGKAVLFPLQLMSLVRSLRTNQGV